MTIVNTFIHTNVLTLVDAFGITIVHSSRFWQGADMYEDDYENPVDREISKIDDWLKESGMAESRLGQLACANARAVERIRNGTARVESLRQVLDYIALNPAKRGKK